MMTIRFWGVRGSLATGGPTTAKVPLDRSLSEWSDHVAHCAW
jgi:hypothetical protein